MFIKFIKMSYAILVLLDLSLQISSAPGQFHHDFYRPASPGYHGGPGSHSWQDWGSSWDHQWDRHTTRVASTTPSYHGYDGGSYHGLPVTSHVTPQSTITPTPGDVTTVYEVKTDIDTVIGEVGTATSDNSAVTGDASLVMGDLSSDRSAVATGDIIPAIISDGNAVANGDAIADSNGVIVLSDQNLSHDQKVVDQVTQNQKDVHNDKSQNDQNTDAPEATVTIKPEEEQVFGASAIGSRPVPKLNGTSAPTFQWHVGVYSKAWTPYMQICGGSLVKQDVVISAAHCFWTDATGRQPPTQFAVAGGKLYRPWHISMDEKAQRSDVSEIILPVRFRGIMTSFQDDIAVLRLSTPFVYAEGVRPVCVDFSVVLERRHLMQGRAGTVAGWGLTEENGGPSQRLNYLEMPYVDVDECVTSSEPSFVKYITSDKICAGDQLSGKALCRGDSGGGLVFFSGTTPYLRGIASTAAANENLCNAFAIATFTHVRAHMTFLRDNIPDIDIDEECVRNSDENNLTGNRAELVTGEGNIGTGKGDKNKVDAMKENGEETTSGLPVISNYPPHWSQVPYSNYFCNCNCKS